MFAGLVSVLAAAAGCTPTSEQPLSDERSSKLDERLLGKWQSDQVPVRLTPNPGGPSFVEIKGRAESATGLELIKLSKRSAAEEAMPFYTTQIGDDRYLTVDAGGAEATPRAEKTLYYILRYRFVDDDTVEFYAMDDKAIAQTIAKGELKGSYLGGNPSSAKCVVIADSPENIRRYLEKHGDECFLRARTDRFVMLTRRSE
ncbi:MAG TPA: hypothetical protein VGN42_11705 [Pirellulales bacterium]|nr:hypothetical protein [Pirellulales bacterium]